MRHSLKLDFANTGRVDPRVTVERAGSQSYFDEFGVMRFASPNMLAIDHDPVTHDCLGASIWGARTNQYLHSSSLDNPSWAKTRASVVADAAIAPDGTMTMDKLVEDTSASTSHYCYQWVSVTAGKSYVISRFVKAAERSACSLTFFNSNGAFHDGGGDAYFDLTLGILNRKDATVTDAGIDAIGNGVYRIWAASVAIATATGNIGLQLATTGVNTVYTGDGVSGLYVCGAQLEEDAVKPSPYIPTTTSQVTRPATIAKIDGTKFTDFYSQTEGTFVAVGKGKKNSPLCSVDGADAYYRLTLGRIADGRAQFYCRNNGTGDTSLNNTGDVGDGFYRMASAYKLNDAAQSTNGATCITGAPSALATPTRLSIGQYISALSQCDGHIKSITYYPIRLSNETLQALAK